MFSFLVLLTAVQIRGSWSNCGFTTIPVHAVLWNVQKCSAVV